MTQTTSFDKKLGRKPFRAIKQGLLALLLVGGLFLFSEVKSASIFEDSFEDYDLGILGGQGDWATTTNPLAHDFYVVDDDKNFGWQSIWASSTIVADPRRARRSGASSTNGIISFYWKITDTTTSKDFGFSLGENDPDDTKIWFRVWYNHTTKIISTNYHDTEDREISQWEEETPVWHFTQIKWQGSNNKAKFKTDDESWTDWVDCFGDWDTIGSVHIYSWINAYFDDISGYRCDSEHCGLCETYDTCIDAGCTWDYSIFLQQWFCGTYYEAEEEDCGSFFSCQFCTTQELCEAELNCEWKNIGFGDRCYMVEPTIPPEEVAWEVPDCEGLGTLETWLCENIVPSQEKINDLYLTIGAFKEKFPFNYVVAMNDFFDEIGESIDEEKSIPITILGQESNVSFTFWNSTTSIGGEEETLKNVVFDFTSMIIFMGWFVWLISLIRRFFQ